MSCIGKNFLLNLMLNFPVMHRLSLPPFIVTDVVLFSFRVKLLVGTYFSGVWSMLMVIEPGILCFSIVVIISWWSSNSISRLAPSGILTLGDIFIRRTQPIRLNRLDVQLDEEMSMFPTVLVYFWMNALSAAMARLEFMKVPQELTTVIFDWTIVF